MAEENRERQGVAGWLLLFLAALGTVAPAYVLFMAGRILYGTLNDSLFGPRWPLIQALELGLAVATCIAIWFACWRLAFVRNWQSVRITIFTLCWTFVWIVFVQPLLFVLIVPLRPEYLVAYFLFSWFRPFLFTGIAIAYLLRSGRVARTYPRSISPAQLEETFE